MIFLFARPMGANTTLTIPAVSIVAVDMDIAAFGLFVRVACCVR
jgi:hypothetical protein